MRSRIAANNSRGTATARLLRLLDEFGAARMEQAVREALDKDIPHHQAVQQILERQRRAEGRHPALPVQLPDDPRVRDLAVRPHPLESYDTLTKDIVDHQEQDPHDQYHASAERLPECNRASNSRARSLRRGLQYGGGRPPRA